jgi:hypothetical protein
MNQIVENGRVKDELRDKVADESKRIVRNVRYTDYKHQTEVDEYTGTYIMDCSGFVSYALDRVAPSHLAMIPKEADQPRPRAFKFYEYFSALKPNTNGWHRIHHLLQVRRGDIIAWRHPGPIKPHNDTGHVLIVAEAPMGQDEQISAVTVHVYDSSNVPHNQDTRRDGVTGVGMGAVVFLADSQGRPSSFQFKVGDRFYSFPIAVGRIQAFNDAIPPRKKG